VLLGLGGCTVLIVLLLVVVGGCAAIIANIGGGTESKSRTPKGEQAAVSVGEPVTVGDVVWQVSNARQVNQLTAQFADPKQGNFVVVNFSFTNNGNEPATLDNEPLPLIDSEGRKFKTEADLIRYVPRDRNVFLERVNRGVTREGQAIFQGAAGASGFKLQAGDTNPFTDENGYVDLGF